MVGDYGGIGMQATIGAGDFKAKCLKLLDDVAQTKEILIITKRGKPVAKLVPISTEVDLYGALAGSVVAEGDIISPLDNEWAACK
jgi:prevent-host-death family protein